MKNKLPNSRGKHDLEFSLCITSLVWNIRELFPKLIGSPFSFSIHLSLFIL